MEKVEPTMTAAERRALVDAPFRSIPVEHRLDATIVRPLMLTAGGLWSHRYRALDELEDMGQYQYLPRAPIRRVDERREKAASLRETRGLQGRRANRVSLKRQWWAQRG